MMVCSLVFNQARRELNRVEMTGVASQRNKTSSPISYLFYKDDNEAAKVRKRNGTEIGLKA